jgi:uncharacterized membrane protein
VIYGHGAYKVLLLLHLLSVVIGFGPWMLNGLLPRWALSRSAEEGQAVNGAAYRISNISQFAIYAAFIFGFATVGSADHNVIKVSQAWVWISILCWLAIVGVMHGLALPAQRQLRDGEGDRAAVTQRLSLAAGIINLLVIVAIVMMVFEPGNKLV